MASVIDECDVDYGLSVDMSGAYYENALTTVPMASRGIKVFRRLMFTKRTVQALRKRGVLSKRTAFLWKVGKWVGNLQRDSFAVPVLAVMGLGALLMIFTSLSVGLAVFFIASLSALLLDSVKWSVRKQLAKFEQHISEKYSQSRRVEFPMFLMKSHADEANAFVNARGNETVLNMDEKKQLFELLGKYPIEIDEQIAKLKRTKAQLPQNNREAEMVLNEINAALEKLFAARDTEENVRVLEAVRELFVSAARRKDVEELGPAVSELSDVSEFLNGLPKKSEAEVSEVVGALNKAAVPADADEETLDELFVKQHLDEGSRKQQHYS